MILYLIQIFEAVIFKFSFHAHKLFLFIFDFDVAFILRHIFNTSTMTIDIRMATTTRNAIDLSVWGHEAFERAAEINHFDLFIYKDGVDLIYVLLLCE